MRMDRGWLIIDAPGYTTIEKGHHFDCVAIDRRKLNPGQAMMALALVRDRCPAAFIVGVGEYAGGTSSIEAQAYNVITLNHLTTPWSYALDAIRTKHLNTKEEEEDGRLRDVSRQERNPDVPPEGQLPALHCNTEHAPVVRRSADERGPDVRLHSRHQEDARGDEAGRLAPTMSNDLKDRLPPTKLARIWSLAREAVRTATLAVESTTDDENLNRAAEARHALNHVLDPLTVLDLFELVDDLERELKAFQG